MQSIASGCMCIQKYINTCTRPCNRVIVDIYVQQRRSLPARPSAREVCATAPKHDMASCLPASAKNITFEAHQSCYIAEIQQIGGGQQRVEIFVGHPQPYSRRFSTSSSVILRRMYWKGLRFRFPPTMPLPAAVSTPGCRLLR